MSSHHVVRDTQEPALIIANGESCSFSLVQQLLEWSPTVMVLDGAMQRVIDLGIKVDILLGDFDRNLNPEDILKHQQPVEIIRTPNQDKTDLQKGIELLISRGHKAINIVWATGRRADHTIGNITSLVQYKNHVVLVMYDDYSKIFCLNQHYTKWYKKGTPLSIIPVGKVTGVNSTGLKYNLKNDDLTIGYKTSASNETLANGIVEITHQSGDLLLMECHD